MVFPRSWQVPFALFVLALVATTLVYQFPTASVIDVGSGGDAPFVQNFSFRENLPDGTNARWSNGRAEIRFVGIGAQDGVLQVRYAAPRPQTRAQVQILANGTAVSNAAPGNDFQAYTFPITRAGIGLGGNLTVNLNSDTFTQAPDVRQLGLLVDSVRFAPSGAPVIPSPGVLFYLPALAVLVFFIAKVWSGSARIALVVSSTALVGGVVGLYLKRVETAYFVAPLFWFLLLSVGVSLALAFAFQQVGRALNAPVLAVRTLRLVLLVMVLALAVRMIFAVGTGYIVDVQDYVVWSYKTVTYGIGSAYVALDGLWTADNPPGMLYVFDGMGRLYRAVFAPDFLYPAVAGDPNLRALSDNVAVLADPVHRTLLRLPFLLADLITGALLFVVARKNLSERAAWLVALGYWFNPAVLWNGAYWGQTDALHSLLILAAFLLLNVRRVGWGFFVYGIAALIKPQATIFVPLLVLYAWRVGAWRGLVRAGVCGALGAGLMLAPMLVSGGAASMLGFFQNVAGFHPVISANAHNVWWLISGGQADVLDTRALFAGAPLSYRLTSLLLFGAVYLAVLWRGYRAATDEFFELGAFVAFAFFMLATEIHENHGYALLPLLAAALTRDTKLIALYVVLSVTMTLNYALHDPPVLERLQLPASNVWQWLNALLNTIVLGAWAVYLFARRGLQAHWKQAQPQRVM